MYWRINLFNRSKCSVFSQEVRSELEQEMGQLKSFCTLCTDLSQSEALGNKQSLLDNTKEVSDSFTQLEASINQR